MRFSSQLLMTITVLSCATAFGQVSGANVQRARQARAVAGQPAAAHAGGDQAQNSVLNTSRRPTGVRSVAGSASLAGLSAAVTAYATDTGRLPGTTEPLTALLYPPPGVKNWRGPYVSVPPGKPPFTDPWGNQYQLIDTTRPGAAPSFKIRSLGPDGLPDTVDDLAVGY